MNPHRSHTAEWALHEAIKWESLGYVHLAEDYLNLAIRYAAEHYSIGRH